MVANAVLKAKNLVLSLLAGNLNENGPCFIKGPSVSVGERFMDRLPEAGQ
jgi:hypothetical protein